MSHMVADTDWLRRIEALTVEPDGQGPQDQVVAARMLVVRLVAAARSVSSSPAAAAACPPVAASLAPELATVDIPPAPASAGAGADELAAGYLHALCHAAGAVYLCRRVAHASGHCWFSVEGPDADVCGRVLVAGHRCAAVG